MKRWWPILQRTVQEFQEDHLTDWAAALTYYAVLSVFPALLALVSVVGLVVDPDTLTRVLNDGVEKLGPESATDTFAAPIRSFSRNQGAAGVLLVIGLLGALWTASGWVGAFMRASNTIYETEEGRSFWKRRPLQLFVTLAMMVFLALLLVGLVVTGPVARDVGDTIGVGDAAVSAWNIAKWPVLFLLATVMFASLYYIAPSAKLRRFRLFTPGSMLAVFLFVLASAGFALYVANFGSYDQTYGTLGGVITFLIWLWIANLAILLGQELNAEVERERQLEDGVPLAADELQLPVRD
ncbi:MAG: YihY/virulence factor BrkB family protein [Thermoleophilaceae bacterium]|nr:YihY/virulence factor BrkB family protein [Thermoleophilaceae bacterium]